MVFASKEEADDWPSAQERERLAELEKGRVPPWPQELRDAMSTYETAKSTYHQEYDEWARRTGGQGTFPGKKPVLSAAILEQMATALPSPSDYPSPPDYAGSGYAGEMVGRLMSMNIKEMEISVRLEHGVEKANLSTVAEVITFLKADRELPGCGPLSHIELLKKFSDVLGL
jgi:hypothetical protein